MEAWNPLNRRQLLAQCGAGAGLLGLATLLEEEGLLGAPGSAATVAASDLTAGDLNPLAARSPHFAARAKRVIWLFINGGPSHVDTWDYKPELAKRDGVKLQDFDAETGFFKNQVGGLMKSPWAFRRHGECGKWVSDLFPNLAEHVDKMAFIHSGYTLSNNHSPALFMMNSGFPRMGYPCVGAWATYGLGSESRDLPAFCVMSDPLDRGLPKGHASNWAAGFLPGAFQGTHLRPKGAPIDNLSAPEQMSSAAQRRQLDLLAKLNHAHRTDYPAESEMAARIESFELAYRMQTAAPTALDTASEPEHIKRLYGVNEKRCGHFAAQCLLARRLVERGVRFVQIYSGGMENQRSWDGHMDIQGNHSQFAGETDQPIAALLTDLDQRGLLDDTLVIWGGEFGRLPIAQTGAKPGRDHNPHAFTYWLAGGGVRGGVSHGATDEIGFRAVEDRVHVNDLHATILHLLGIDHERLTFRYSGRDFRLTDVAGRVVKSIVA